MDDRLEELCALLLAAETEPPPGLPFTRYMAVAAGRHGWLSDRDNPHIPVAVPGA